MRKLLLLFLIPVLIFGQKFPDYTSSKKKVESFEKRIEKEKKSLFQNLEFRNVGPTVCSGRAVDLAVDPSDPTHFYVAYASSGLWETKNNGISFSPLFDKEAAMTIGDIAVDWNKNKTIWVGTGESNAFLFPGVGIYRSDDAGQTWQHMGLEETHSITRVIVHPDNPDVVWASAIGHLYSNNPVRGVFKTTNGGKTWNKTLFVSDSAGITDMVLDPTNPDILYAASWERYRKPWKRKKSGKESGIYKSIDGGETWELISTDDSGFPKGNGIGRIGLTICATQPNVLYAMVDNQTEKAETKSEDKDSYKKELFKEISKDDFLELDSTKFAKFLVNNRFPKEYSVKYIFDKVKNNELEPNVVYKYLTDPTSPESKEIVGAEIYRSDDYGKTWTKTHSEHIDNLIFSYGYVFDIIRVTHDNPDKFYIAGVPILKSEDGGKSFSSIGKENVHVDHHALWINPNKNGHLINCNDGGVNITYDDGEHWFKANSEPVSQCYAVNYDMKDPYNIYVGFQDNGVWVGPSNYKKSYRWRQTGQYPYESIMGGDGFHTQVDSRNEIVYTGYQYGYYYRINRENNDYKMIRPQHELGEYQLRFNWQTPILLSKHNEDILYIGSNKLYRSMDKGETFEAISNDLSKGGKFGDVPYGTITSISESPFKFGLIYVGADDGSVKLTKDGGNEWIDISKGLPEHFAVTDIIASKHKKGRVIVSLNGFKFDNSTAEIYLSENFGKDWRKISNSIPLEPVNAIAEDPANENIIYAGTDNGLYISLNKGNKFYPVSREQLPAVSVHDIKVHPRENDLIVGTHGRSVYIADVENLQQLTQRTLSKEIELFQLEDIRHNNSWGKIRTLWSDPNKTELQIPFYSKNDSEVKISIMKNNKTLNSFTENCVKGLNYAKYDLSLDEDLVGNLDEDVTKSDDESYYLPKGKYKVVLESNGTEVEKSFSIK